MNEKKKYKRCIPYIQYTYLQLDQTFDLSTLIYLWTPSQRRVSTAGKEVFALPYCLIIDAVDGLWIYNVHEYL